MSGTVDAGVSDDAHRQRGLHLWVCCARVADGSLLAVVVAVVIAAGTAGAMAGAANNTSGRQHNSTILAAVVGGARARAGRRVVEDSGRHPAWDRIMGAAWTTLVSANDVE